MYSTGIISIGNHSTYYVLIEYKELSSLNLYNKCKAPGRFAYSVLISIRKTQVYPVSNYQRGYKGAVMNYKHLSFTERNNYKKIAKIRSEDKRKKQI